MIQDLLNKYLIEQETDDDPVFDMMVDLLSSLNPDDLDEDQQDILGNILNEIGLISDEDEYHEVEDDEGIDEKKIMRVSRKKHIALKKNYKRNKARFKMMSKRFRKTSAYKQWKKKHKRMVKAGRTRTKKYV